MTLKTARIESALYAIAFAADVVTASRRFVAGGTRAALPHVIAASLSGAVLLLGRATR